MRLLLVLLAAVLFGGCRFWYKPVPVANAIGEAETVLAGDTVNVYRGDRFEVYGPNPEAVYDGYEQLNRAYRAFERHVGTAARLAVVLSADTTMPLDSSAIRGFRDRGLTLVRYSRPRNFRSPSRYGALGYGGVVWPIAPTAARALLARFADEHVESARARSESALLERFPMWFRAAVIHLVGQSASQATDLELVRERREQLLALPELLRLVRPASADSMYDPTRQDETDELTRLLAAQASVVARYLIEQEGRMVLGTLGRGYLEGRSLTEMTAEFRSAPRSLDELERRWKIWIDSKEF